MLKVYGTWLCPNCRAAEQHLIAAKVEFEFVDIFNSTANMKEFLKLRDNEQAFQDVKAKGGIGIPAFVKENGMVTHTIEDIL